MNKWLFFLKPWAEDLEGQAVRGRHGSEGRMKPLQGRRDWGGVQLDAHVLAEAC